MILQEEGNHICAMEIEESSLPLSHSACEQREAVYYLAFYYLAYIYLKIIFCP